MCGRFSVFIGDTDVEDRFDAVPTRDVRKRYNVAPGTEIPAIEAETPHKIDFLHWGFVPHWSDDPQGGPTPINARGETVHEKPMFEDAFVERRCLVLADGFYEWQQHDGGPKQPYRITLEDDDLFAFAGVYETWDGDDGNTLTSTTIITTEANDVVEPIHDRMPVILERDQERAYLEATEVDEAREYLDPYDGDDLRAYPISTYVNDPAHDEPRVLEPVDASENAQSGLGDFSAS